jgi:hypothetical protein
MSNEIYHYGVGHKDGGHSSRYPWGSGKEGLLRRHKLKKYEKKGGSYTQTGLKNYSESKEYYLRKKQEAKDAKTAYKAGKMDAREYRDAKYNAKKAKDLNELDYKQLKKDYQGDKGKELYANNVRITSNESTKAVMAMISTGAAYVSYTLYNNGNIKAAMATAAVTTGGNLVAAFMAHKMNSQNKNLRAYYAHNRNYRKGVHTV